VCARERESLRLVLEHIFRLKFNDNFVHFLTAHFSNLLESNFVIDANAYFP